ncbi:uncharacterized protein BDZ99DRAFT_461364 [Mytilinidion resinicola]|uniref:Uncharacterized protein n=1 Tax=Mytilinidion resinicola TaxID=574789 RepID=A0A6A6YXR8_9PEZI|nr:uncharacterized protein BDZ99DRAFT_461364 [Mytilinidion resinicola]KAF2812715.1 hypothetical protein BDZ99DRAFT_461364 [Mytilinidion resinicola]
MPLEKGKSKGNAKTGASHDDQPYRMNGMGESAKLELRRKVAEKDAVIEARDREIETLGANFDSLRTENERLHAENELPPEDERALMTSNANIEQLQENLSNVEAEKIRNTKEKDATIEQLNDWYDNLVSKFGITGRP